MNEALTRWLELRETADWQARSDRLARRVAAHTTGSVVRVLDLGTGTGSNVRYLIDRLPPRQEWLVADRDPGLLDDLTARLAKWARARSFRVSRVGAGCRIEGPLVDCVVETRPADLGALDEALFAGRHLVTASALLDLASAGWLQALAGCCRASRAAALFAITYNGCSWCDPPESQDEVIRTLFNQHQKRDKGLGGPAAGPDACLVAEQSFAGAGYRVERAASDWTIGPEDAEFQRQLVAGWAAAAADVAPDRADMIDEWHRRRVAHIEVGRSRVRVGHYDMAAWLEPPV